MIDLCGGTTGMDCVVGWAQIVGALATSAAVFAAVWLGRLQTQPHLLFSVDGLRRTPKGERAPHSSLVLTFVGTGVIPVSVLRVEFGLAFHPTATFSMPAADFDEYGIEEPSNWAEQVLFGEIRTAWVGGPWLAMRIAHGLDWGPFRAAFSHGWQRRLISITAIGSTGKRFRAKVPSDMRMAVWELVQAGRASPELNEKPFIGPKL